MSKDTNEYIKQQLIKLNVYKDDMSFKYEYIFDENKVNIFITNKSGLRFVSGKGEDIYEAIDTALKNLVSKKRKRDV